MSNPQIKDEILTYLNIHGKKPFSELKDHLLPKVDNQETFEPLLVALIQSMVKQQYLKAENLDNIQSSNIEIISEGRLLHANNGFVEIERKEKEAKDLEKNLKESVITTNISVKNTNKVQKILVGLATLFSALGVLVTYLNYKKDTVIKVLPPSVIIQQLPLSSKQDTSSQNTSQNRPPYPKHP